MNDQYQGTETEIPKWNSAIIYCIIDTCDIKKCLEKEILIPLGEPGAG